MNTARQAAQPAVLPGPAVSRQGGTAYAGIFRALAEPFGRDEVKSRSQGGRQLSYITARTAMIRLDEVVGPENWSDRYYEVVGVLFCELTITLPDGSKVSKADAGGFKDMVTKEAGQTVKDQENTDKTGPSDAFKRAAAKFGIARYLYNDGVADLSEPEAAPVPDNGSGHGRGSYASPDQVKLYEERLRAWIDKKNRDWADSWPTEALAYLSKTDTAELLSTWQANGHLVKWAVKTGRLDPAIIPEDCKPAQKPKYVAVVYHRSTEDRRALGLEMERYAAEEARLKRDAIHRKHPETQPEDGDGDDGIVPDEFAEEPEAGPTPNAGREPGED